MSNSEERQVVVFSLVPEKYGIDISKVKEIIPLQTITAVPCSNPWVEGIINLRGRVIPVVSLRKIFGKELAEETRQTRIVVVEIGGDVLGMVVDAVTEVLQIPEGVIEPPSAFVTSVEASYLEGVAKLEERIIILLNLENILQNKMAGALAG